MDSYPPASRIKDIDGNGVANIMDAQYILMFVYGNYKYTKNYTNFDVNNDYLVDGNDSYEYLRYVTHYMSLGEPAPFTASDNSSTYYDRNQTISYRVYNAQTKAYKSSYSLSVNDLDLSYSPDMSSFLSRMENTRMNGGSIIDTSTYPAGMVKLIMKETPNSGSYRCSGFVVDDHTIATVAHSIVNLHKNNISNSWTFTISSCVTMNLYDDEGYFIQTLTPVEYHFPNSYLTPHYYSATNPETTDGYDYALISVEEDLSDYISIEPGLALDTYQNSGDTIFTTGFPVSIDYEYVNQIVTNSNIILPTNSQNMDPLSILHYNCAPTSSGAPLYRNTYTAIGVCNAGYGESTDEGCATRFTRDILQFLYNNPNISY